jgi:NitT/TauT family transport system substrate-binding protein
MSRFSARTPLFLTAALALVVAATGCSKSSSAGGDGTKTVRIGIQKVTADGGLFLADDLGFFKQQGIKVKFNRMNDASTITNALATGQLDVAGATITPGTFQAAAKHLPIRIVGDKNFMAPKRGDLPPMSGTRLGVLAKYAKGDLKSTLEALRGKKLAIHSKLSIQIVYLSMLLEKYGMKLSDFKITPVLSPDQTAALKNGAIDAAVMQEPYFSQAVAHQIVKPASDLTEELPSSGVSTTALLYGKQLLNDKATGKKFMLAYLKGVRAYNDAMFYGKGKDKVLQVLSKNTDVPVNDLAHVYPPGLDPNQNIEPSWIQTCEDFYRSNGMLDAKVAIPDLVDTEFRDAATKELGQYEPPKS